jgi:anti-anti-sigma factor
MAAAMFEVAVEATAGVVCVRACGDIDLLTEPVLLEHLRTAVAAACAVVVVDLTECAFISSRAVRELEATAVMLQRDGARLVLRRPPASFALLDGHARGPWTFDVERDGRLGLVPSDDP